MNIAEAAGQVAITGTVGGDVPNGATVTVTVNGVDYTGPVAGGTFSIDVPGSALLADGDLTVEASVTVTDAAGNSTTATDSRTYSLDESAPSVSVGLNPVAEDDIINIAEGQEDVAITGTVGGDVPNGATVTVTVNGVDYTGTVAAGAFSILVPGSGLLADGDLTVEASVTVTDAAGNSTTATDTRTYSLDQVAPSASITLDPVTSDNIVNIAEGEDDVAITGTVGGDVPNGATVTVTVNGVDYTGTVAAGAFSILVPGSGLLADGDLTVAASVTVADAAGNSTTATDTQGYTLDQVAPSASITLDAIASDDILDQIEASGQVAITGTVGGDVADGATVTLTVNAGDYTGTVSGGVFSIEVPGSALEADVDLTVEASVAVADAAGNTSTATDTRTYTLQADTGLDIDIATMTAAQGFRIFGADAGDQTGRSVSSAGDINGDGYDDLIVGAPIGAGPGNGRDDAGEAIVIFGMASGFTDIDLATMTAADGFRIFGMDAYDQAGWSVSAAGDINGDGFGDLIIGMGEGNGPDNSRWIAGEAIVIFGKGSPFTDIDVATMTAADGFRIFGADSYDHAGSSVASAGDINGDGFDDLIIGALYGAGPDNSRTYAGEAIVIFGKGSPFTDIDVATMTAADGFRIFGADAFDRAGISVSSAGDINGDGYDDLIVGVSGGDGPDGDRFSGGEAIVIFGKPTGFTDIDVATMTSADGFRIFGADPGDWAGISVSAAGDVDGDGHADLIVGANRADGPDGARSYAGEAIVIFGKPTGFGDIDVAAMTPADGFRIFNASAGDHGGISVSSAGDINGDGYGDLIVGAYSGSGPNGTRGYAGEAIVIFGKGTGFADIDVATMTETDGFRIFGADANDGAGISVSSAGDINGDGFADLIIGAYRADSVGNGRSDAGEAVVIVGGDFLGSVVRAGTAGDDTLTGTAAAESFVGGQGNDLMVGNGGEDSFHGGAGDDTISVADLTFRKIDGGSGVDTVALDAAGSAIDLTGVAGRRITAIEKIDLGGSHANTLALSKLAVLGMAGSNGDAFAANMLLVKGDAGDRVSLLDGWTKGSTVTDPHGETGDYVTWTNGAATLLIASAVEVYSGAIDVATMTAAQGFRVFGADVFDYAGVSVSSAGDINGDGFDDLIIGATGGDGPVTGRASAGEAIVVFGKAGGFADIDVSSATFVSSGAGFRIFGADSGDGAGISVSYVGDINGDGFADLIVGAWGGDGAANDKSDVGEAIVVFGKAAGFANVDVSSATFVFSGGGFRIFGGDAGDAAGVSVSSAGDINGDGFDDLIIGARLGDGATNGKPSAGEAIVVFGKAGGFADIDVSSATFASSGAGFRIFGADTTDQAGWSVSSAGDVNGDGFADLIIGALGGDGAANGKSYAGEAIVIFGKAGGFADIDVSSATFVSSGAGFRIFGADASDRAGFSVSSAGDINGDGFEDLIVGAWTSAGAANGKSYAGEAIVVFGKAGGFADIDASASDFVSSGTGFRIFGADSEDQAGKAVSAAGDVNGDGFDDLIVTASYGDGATNGKSHAGEAIVIFGKASGITDIDVSTMSAADGFRIHGADAGDLAGSSVSSAGDIDGDGFDDLIVGAPFGDGPTNSRTNAGEAIVIFGGDFLARVTFAGTAGADTLTGTEAAESFVGGQGDDLMVGNGGEDSFRGGAGDDTISVADLAFRKIDGGSGTDTLAFAGMDMTIDFTLIANNRIAGIEALDVRGTGDDTIVLGALDILHFSDTPHAGFTGAESHKRLVIHGDAGDTLDLRDFDPGSGGAYEWQLVAAGRNLDGTGGGGFDVYNLMRSSKVVASLAVDADMLVA